MPESNVIGLALVGGLGYLAYKECMLEDSCIGPESCDFPDECYGADNGDDGPPPSNGGGNGGNGQCTAYLETGTNPCCQPDDIDYSIRPNPRTGECMAVSGGSVTKENPNHGRKGVHTLFVPLNADKPGDPTTPSRAYDFRVWWDVEGLPGNPWCLAFFRIWRVYADGTREIIDQADLTRTDPVGHELEHWPNEIYPGAVQRAKLRDQVSPAVVKPMTGYEFELTLDISSAPLAGPCGMPRCPNPLGRGCRQPYSVIRKVRVTEVA